MTEQNVDIGEALYAISLNLIERSSPDLLQKFIGPCKNEQGEPMTDDGIMITTGGYYRVAEDQTTGNRVVLFSFSYDKLTGIRDKGGKIRLGNTDGVYPVIFQKKPPFGAKRGGALRADMSDHHYKLQRGFKEDLNLYGADLTGLFNTVADPDTPDPKVMKFGNTMLSYGLYENAEGKWELRRRLREKQPDEVAPDSVLGLDKAGSGKILDKLLSNGESLGIFATREEAMAAMVLDFNKRGDRKWNALPFLEPSEIAQAPIASAKRGIVSQTVNFIKGRSVGELLFVGGMALIALPFSGKFRAAQLGIAAAGIASVYANKLFEQLFVNSVSLLDKMVFWRKESIKTLFRKKDASEDAPRATLEDYMEETENNKKRWCSRIRPGVASDLCLLTSSEVDLKPEDAPYDIPPGQKGNNPATAWAKLEMPTVQNSAFKAIATPLDTRTMSYYYLMGAVAVTHTHKDQSRSVYIMMRPDMKVSEKSFIRPEIEPYMKNGHVLHVRQTPGEEATAEMMDIETTLQDIKGFLYRESGKPDKHTASAVQHIKWLFGWSEKKRSPQDIDHDLADMYAQTAGCDKQIDALFKGQPTKTLNVANPTPEQIAKFIEVKGKARAEFSRKQSLTRAMERSNFPHFKPILEAMNLA